MMRKNSKVFINFIKKYWVVFSISFLLTAIIYYPKISNYNYSIDTERMIRFPNDTLTWWLRLGRYGLVWLTKLSIFGKGTHIIYINILTYLLLFISSIILVYILDKQARRSKIEQLVSIGLFLTTPIILEQTNFVLQSAPVVFSTITMMIGYGFLKKFLESRKNIFLLLGIIFETFSFSVYVSLITGFVALTIVDLCYNSRVEAWSAKKYFSRVLFMAISSILSYAGYILGNKIIYHIFSLKSSDYLSESRLWGKIPNGEVLSTIKSTFFYNFKLDSPFVFWEIILLLIIFMITSFVNRENILITLVSILGLVIVGTYTVPLFGYFGTLRSYYPLYPIILYGLAVNIFQSVNFKAFNGLICLLSIMIIGLQAYNTLIFENNEANLYKQELSFVHSFNEELKKDHITNLQNYKLAIIGGKSFKESIHGDMLGNSVFNWDLGSEVGVSYRAGDFIYNQGLKFERISPDDYKEALNSMKDMEVYPNKKSIKIVDDILIVRLS